MDANATTQEHGWIEATIDIEVGNLGDPGYEIHHVRSGYLQTIADFCAWYRNWLHSTVRPLPQTLRLFRR